MADGGAIGLGGCHTCGLPFTFDPDTVRTISIDPQTNRPPDVNEHGDLVDPDPAAVARAVKRPICPDCEEKINRARVARGMQPWPPIPRTGNPG